LERGLNDGQTEGKGGGGGWVRWFIVGVCVCMCV
jgi:hypothetical protein